MRYERIVSKKFKKSLRKLEKSGSFDLDILFNIVESLSSGKRLPSNFKDHPLQGKLQNFRECHIKPDLLLIYFIDTSTNELNLFDLGSHSELFG